jgi:arylsulfatase A-like enzyme
MVDHPSGEWTGAHTGKGAPAHTPADSLLLHNTSLPFYGEKNFVKYVTKEGGVSHTPNSLPMPQPNVLFIFTDQWRGDCLGSLGHPVVETPYLDELAARGTTFPHAYSPCPSCIAARASVVTGQTPTTHGRLGYRDGVPWRYTPTLMSLLRDGGYQTINVGKTHFYPQRAYLGFEINLIYESINYLGTFESDYHLWLERETRGTVRDTAREMPCNSWMARPWTHPEYLHPTNWTTDTALDVLARRDPTRPFFLQVGYHRPHPPIDPPLAWYEQYHDRPLPPVPVGDWCAEWDQPTLEIEAARGRLPAHLLARGLRAYYAQISHLDYQIGRLLQAVGRDTYVIFTSDHGEMLGDHCLFRKTYPFEGSARVPFLIAGPGVKSGQLRPEPITLADIMPTVLEAAGLAIPASVEGASLAPLTRGESVPWRDAIHGEHSSCYGQEGWQFITDGVEKFCWETLSGRELFFDLAADPQELHNLSADPAAAERVTRWRQRLIDEFATHRPQDALTDGTRLIAGTLLPAVRPELLA